MELSHYLKGIRDCPDDRLGQDWGIADNYPIELRMRYKDFVRDLESSLLLPPVTWSFQEERRMLGGERASFFHYLPGVVVLQARERAAVALPPEQAQGVVQEAFKSRGRRAFNPHEVFRTAAFNLLVLLHPYAAGAGETEGQKARLMADAVEDICWHAARAQVPLCLAKTTGLEHTSKAGHPYPCGTCADRIVYHGIERPTFSPELERMLAALPRPSP